MTKKEKETLEMILKDLEYAALRRDLNSRNIIIAKSIGALMCIIHITNNNKC